MKHLLRLMPAIVALLSSLAVPAQIVPDDMTTTEPSLVVWQKDGTTVCFLLRERPKVVYDGDTVRISTPSLAADYPFSAIRKMTYPDANDIDGVDEVAAPDKPFAVKGEGLTFSAGRKPLDVRLFTADGKLVRAFSVGEASSATLPLGSLTAGIYLVSVDGVTYKISLR